MAHSLVCARGQPSIGPRLREARKRRGLSLAELAERSDLTKGFLSQVERDLTSPSVAPCCACARRSSCRSASCSAAARDRWRTPVAFGGQGVTEYQLTSAQEARLLVLESEIAPGGGSGEDAYELDCDSEFLHVLDGMLDVEVAGTRYRLAAGDSLTFDAGAPHRWWNPSSARPARVL